MQQIAAFNGQTVNFGVNFQSNTPVAPGSMGQGESYGSQTIQNAVNTLTGSQLHSRDSGGIGIAGQSYAIGTGAQPEIFTPSTNGTFTPANKIGSTYNITINNPVPEKSENSIRQSLKKLSYMGVAQ